MTDDLFGGSWRVKRPCLATATGDPVYGMTRSGADDTAGEGLEVGWTVVDGYVD